MRRASKMTVNHHKTTGETKQARRTSASSSRVKKDSSVPQNVDTTRKSIVKNVSTAHKIKRKVGECRKCQHCGKLFTSNTNWKRHERTHSSSPPTYKCAACDKTVKSLCSLRRHQLLVHSEERPYSCGLCTSAFKTKHNLIRHLVNNHATTRKTAYQLATDCGAGGRGDEVKPDMARASSKKEIRKKVIPKINRPTMLVKRARAYKLSVAKASKSTPKASTSTHHGKEIVKNQRLKCPECRRKFQSRHQLGQHLLCHSDVRPFPCRLCAWRFKRKDAHFIHLQRMHGMSIKCARTVAYADKTVIPAEAENNHQQREVIVIVGKYKFCTPRLHLERCDRGPAAVGPIQGCDTYKQWFWKDYCKRIEERNMAPLIMTEPDFGMPLHEIADLLLTSTEKQMHG